MNQITIGISGINAVDNPGPGTGIARSLKEDKELNVKIVGLAYDALEPGIYMDWLIDKTYLLPYPSCGPEPFIERLSYIKNKYGIDFIIPNLDAELPIYTRCINEIKNLGIELFIPDEEQYRLRGKDKLAAVAKAIDIQIPETRVIYSCDDLLKATDEIGLPLMVKGAFYKAYRANTTREAISFFHKISAEWGFPIIVQKVVCGDEMNVVGVGDGNGNMIGQLGIKKLSVTSLGKIWTGVTVKNEAMLTAANRFVSQYRWKGPFELECIVEDDTVYLIEINPRFPAWSYFATGVGLNLPANMVRNALGLKTTNNHDYEPGKLFIRYTYETITSIEAFQDMITKGEH